MANRGGVGASSELSEDSPAVLRGVYGTFIADSSIVALRHYAIRPRLSRTLLPVLRAVWRTRYREYY